MRDSVRLLSLDPAAAQALRDRGWDLSELAQDGTGLEAADAVLVAGPEGLARLRTWRTAGHGVGAVLRLGSHEDLPSRAGLEPLTVVRSAEADELEAAIAALARGQLANQIHVAGGVLDPVRSTWTGASGTVALSALETDLIGYLAARPGREVPRDELLRQVWGQRRPGQTRAVDMAISRVRKKLGGTQAIQTARGGGYRLILDTGGLSEGFVGRAAELSRLRSLLQQGHSAQLVGPPAVGKTRTARELFGQLGSAALWVDLHGATGHDALVGRLAGELDVGTPRTGDWTAAARSIGRSVTGRIAVLDHCDDGAEALVDVLDATEAQCAWLLVGQRVHPWPDAAVVALEGLGPEEGAQLLQGRALLAGVVLDAREAARVVPLLDGLPLALELAAVRARSLSLADLEARIEDRLKLLRDPSRGRPRHPPLVDALLEAWGRLEPWLGQQLVQLSSFSADFGVEAAEAVLGEDAALDDLALLVDRSLVQFRDGRYRLLHSVRDFVRHTADPSVVTRADRAHQQWAADRATEARPALDDFGAVACARALVAIRAELEEAFDRAARARQVETVLAIAPVLDVLQVLHGTVAARRALLERTVEATEGAAPLARGEALMLRGGAWMHEDREGSRRDLAAAAVLAREHGDANLEVRAAGSLAMQERYERGAEVALAALDALAPQLADCTDAVALKHRSWAAQTRSIVDRSPVEAVEDAALALIEQATQRRALGTAVAHGAWLSVLRFNAGDLAGASRLGKRVTRWVEELPDRRTRGMVLQNAAITQHLAVRDYAGAVAAMDRVIAAFEEVEPARVIPARSLRGVFRLHLGDHIGAEDDLEAARSWASAHGDQMVWTRAMEQLALLSLDNGRPARALVLLDQALERSQGEIDRLIRLQRATALHLLNRTDEARAGYDALDPQALVASDAVLLAARRAALALELGEPDASDRARQATQAVDRHPGEDADSMRSLLVLLDRGQAIDASWLDPAVPDSRGVEVRVLARLVQRATAL